MRLGTLLGTGRRLTVGRAKPDRGPHPSASALPQDGRDDVDEINAQAILWHVRMRDLAAGEDRTFADWLAQDPRHAAAFAAIRGAQDGDAVAPADADDRRHTPALAWMGTAIAASLAVAVAVGTIQRAEPYEVTTEPGGRRVVALEAGTQVTLNGGTRMRFDRRDTRVATLLVGEALFQVRHDAARPFRLTVAGRGIEDLGTVFNVVSDREDVRVAVAEGSVLYDPGLQRIALRAGEGLVDPAAGQAIRLTKVRAQEVGGWRQGRFTYAGQPLAQVAADLSRTLGVRVMAAPAIASRPFSGAIQLERGANEPPARTLARLMPAFDLRMTQEPDGFVLRPGRGAGS